MVNVPNDHFGPIPAEADPRGLVRIVYCRDKRVNQQQCVPSCIDSHLAPAGHSSRRVVERPPRLPAVGRTLSPCGWHCGTVQRGGPVGGAVRRVRVLTTDHARVHNAIDCGVVSVQSHCLGNFGRYEDDRDEGEWFLYTGSGGRDLSGNKRTNKVQSFDQKFESMNAALKVSCVKGLPVRVVRSFKVRKGR